MQGFKQPIKHFSLLETGQELPNGNLVGFYRVDLGVMAMKAYSKFPTVPASPKYQIG